MARDYLEADWMGVFPEFQGRSELQSVKACWYKAMIERNRQNAINLGVIERKLNVAFKDKNLLLQALLHPSYTNEHPEWGWQSNERLEFLGDAVLECAVTQELFHRFPMSSEGDLTVLRSALVSGAALSRIADAIGLGQALYLGTGEDKSGGRERESNLAAAFEALVGALFLDQRYIACQQVVKELFGESLESLARSGIPRDAKSVLQETLQARGAPSPQYSTAKISGPEHDRLFTIEVRVGSQLMGSGTGRRKALAEQEAATNVLLGLKENVNDW